MGNLIKLAIIFFTMLAASANAAPQKSPFKMLIQTSKSYVNNGYYTYRYKYTITSMTDGLFVTDVVINRGQCKPNIIPPISADKERQIMERLNKNAIMPRENRTPAKVTDTRGVSGVLNFSNTWSFTSPSNQGFTQCAPLEVVVKTNHGPYTFTY